MFLGIDGHFGRHLGFTKKLQGDYRGLLVCYSAHISGDSLKNSASCELIQGYNCCEFFGNDAHFGRHLEFMKTLHGDYCGLLVCYSTHISEATLNNSNC